MPLKKKGKGKGKGKGKAKGKGKKGKGKGKKGSGSKGIKLDKESVLKEALCNVKLWEARFGAADKSRHEYRDNARKLTQQNERLQAAVDKTERDTIEVIAYLKKEDCTKETELDRLKQLVVDLRTEAHREREALIETYSQKIAQLEASLSEKDEEIKVIQGELKTVREFRKRRGEMQQQLDQLQTSLEESEKDHEKSVAAMEYKFFEEKLRLQKEANRRIAELAGKAHEEAVSNIDERTREVYRENLHMANALTLHMEHEEALQKSTGQLEMSNRQLVAEKELNQHLVKEKIGQARRHKKQIKELQDKVAGLEQSLTMLVKEFEEEKHVLEECHASNLEQSRAELVASQQRHELQDREMTHIKKLARKILDERSDVEVFFLEALAHVRKEIASNREQYRQDAQQLYQQQMVAAARGRGRFPQVRTFRAGQEHSTNSVYQDMEQAGSWGRVNEESDKVDISDLTWEQREQVLKLLFFKMNHTPTPKNSKATPTTTLPSLHHLPNPPTGTRLATPPVFITQTNMPTSAGATPTAQRRVVSGQAS